MSTLKTILITGATSGVGYETAVRLLSEGHRVQVTGRSVEVLAELEARGAEAIPLDLTSDDAADHLLHKMIMPDVIIFSAGIAKFALAHETEDRQVEQMFSVNVMAPIQFTQRILPSWMKRRTGHLIYIGSQAGKVATPKAAVYAATKHALIGYTDALRMEVSQYGIDVSVIHPGPIDTAFLDKADDSGTYRGAVGKHLLSVNEVAEVVVKTVRQPRRQLDIPRVMGVTSKLHALAPSLVERIGRKFFMKKMQ
ncbi:SDR family NAD(P)-dependent oxidoreductase [Sporosarcina sp. BI001-red]|uniref:SDR family NAD(P)-dependent oxidoreductase n=1 Tax=Sporosarcina sp. BI001-red TaxID=2282866 RepID=UPI000E226EB8|nr:SDR family NAD(P)-dependent oxidoreductase [Sporosarcina sp. BI001-red]REB10116.1 SDR family NAD(P)-dependent oxidoreductase [Sporosarcina sp. BI001-red]